MPLILFLLFPLFAQSDAAEAYRAGVALFERRQAAEAIPNLERAAHLAPNNAQYWKALGVAHASLEQLRESVEPFHAACKLAPSVLDACYYYGRALYATDRYEDALAPLETALKVDAVRGRAEAAIGQCDEALGRAAEAEQRFRGALARHDAANQQARLAYGRFLVRQGRAAEAVQILDAAQMPETAESRYQLGYALFQCDRLQDAAASLERATRLAGNHEAAHMLLDKVLRRLAANTEPRR